MLETNEPIYDQNDLSRAPTKNVSIEIDFRHLYEITFVYMRFCGPMPDAMIIYKSVKVVYFFAVMVNSLT